MIFSDITHGNSFGVIYNDSPMYSADELNMVEPDLIFLYEDFGSPIDNNGDFI